MARSDGSGASGRRSGRFQKQSTVIGSVARSASLGSVESLLRSVVVSTGLALVVIALWHVVPEISLVTVTAVLGSDTIQWVAVVLFGCALIAAGGMSRSTDHGGS